ncbi:uncharacterized protein LOC131628736 [Vicia villosa]|uniref:uncharacterized protein LOC131628736 n=1 Tax=Vicia villosa TaxID=3911 RepID=UPI00273BA521|nr:uncharacterized protein LOC131628736 [Vicia villosa]
MGGWCDGELKWGDLRISACEVEHAGLLDKVEVLRALLENFEGLHDDNDSVSWLFDSEKTFTVSSCYHRFVALRTPFGPFNRNEEALEMMWKMEVPFKIKAFAWRFFVNRLPTKDLLVYRGINFPTSNLNCVFCNMHLEDKDHMFFKCDVIKVVWKEIDMWVDYPSWKEEESISFFMEWNSKGRVKGIKVGKLEVFWLATCWIIWLIRNGYCFRNDSWNINNIVWNIKILSWRWSSFGDIAHSNYNFHDFCKDTLSFMSLL